MAERTFEVVRREDVPEYERSGRPSPITLALETGQTVFVPTHLRGWSASRTRLAASGQKLHQRVGERNGKRGLFLWAEKNGTGLDD